MARQPRLHVGRAIQARCRNCANPTSRTLLMTTSPNPLAQSDELTVIGAGACTRKIYRCVCHLLADNLSKQVASLIGTIAGRPARIDSSRLFIGSAYIDG
jgi:hypothetical protein